MRPNTTDADREFYQKLVRPLLSDKILNSSPGTSTFTQNGLNELRL